MTPVAVILPDGSLDFDATNLISGDVVLEPLTPSQVLTIPLTEIEWSDAEKILFYMNTEEEEEVSRLSVIQFRHYIRMRIDAQSHKMAIMLATRTFPGVKTDSVFNEGKFSGDSGMVGAEQLWLRQQAEGQGVSTTGKWYCRGLASYPGDPTAWVDSRHDVVRIAKEKNMTVHGYVEHKGHETDPGEDLAIAEELVNDEVADILDSNPFADPEAVRDEVYKLRSGAVDPNPLLVED